MQKKRKYSKQVLQIDVAKLHKLRLAQKMAIVDLAHKANISRNVIYEAMKGKPSMDSSVIKLANALGVEVADLVVGEA